VENSCYNLSGIGYHASGDIKPMTRRGERAAGSHDFVDALTQSYPTNKTLETSIYNVTPGGNKVAWLNANRGRMVGPGRTQEIYAGDSIKLQVHGKYLEDKKQKANTGAFMAVGDRQRLVADLNELAVTTQRAGGGNPIALFNLADTLCKRSTKERCSRSISDLCLV
jgi:hypothetical protein